MKAGVPTALRAPEDGSTGEFAAADALGVLESAHDAFVSMTPEGRITAWNRAAEEMFGWSREEALGRPMHELIVPPSLREAHLTGLRRYLDTGESHVMGQRLQLPALHRDGHELSVELTIVPSGSGVPLRFDAFLADVTDRERADAAQRRLASIVASSSEAILSTGPDGIIASANRAAEELLGYEADEMLGRSIYEFDTSGERADDVRELMEAGHRVPRFDLELRRSDGQHVEVSVSLSPLVDPDGALEGISTILRDETAARRARRALDSANQRAEPASAAAAVGMAVVTPDKQIVAVNDALCRLLGRTAEELEGSNGDVFVHPDDPPMTVADLAVDGAGVERRYVRPDGSVVWALTVASGLGNRSGLVVQALDITERKQGEEDLDRYARELEIRETLVGAGEAPIVADSPGRRDARTDRILDLAKRMLGMDVTFLGELTEDGEVLHRVRGDGASFGLVDGSALGPGESYCERMVDGRIGNIVGASAEEEQVKDLAVTAEAGIGSYVGVPINLQDGTPYGALCGLSHEARNDLGEREVELMHFLAELIGEMLEQDRDEQARRRLELESNSIDALLTALDARDHYTSEHSKTVLALALSVADRLGLDERARNEVEQVSILHDIGKVGIPDSILQKRGPLSEAEWAIMRQHPAVAERMVGNVPSLAHLAPAVRAEHERWDGEGYPDGLVRRAIPIASRITLACDAFHAMTSDRPYRAAISVEEACEELRANAGSQFDPEVVDALLSAIAT